MEKNIFTITDITKYIKRLLTNDTILSDFWLTGEISNFHHHGSGHMYFTLKDENSCISSIMFRGHNSRLKYEVENGMKVIAHGYISIYEPRGTYQLYIDQLEPAGKGALYLAYEQLKMKLEKEGLFDERHKKKIPVLPKKIGIITSPTGAAIRDIISVVKRRFDNVSALIVPSLVQGENASAQLVQAIDYLNKRNDIDLIIISRGGGSIEDLWPFNEENLARAVYNSSIPIISGVGHETDFTIVDFVADLRAATPSAAAELAISSRNELEKYLDNLYNRIINNIQYKIEDRKKKLVNLSHKRVLMNPEELLAKKIQRIDDLSRRIEWQMDKIYKESNEKLRILAARMESLNPLKTLARGYSISIKNNKTITDIKNVNIGDLLETKLTNGKIYSKVIDVEEVENG
ncbi:exodeoxyribonuclease VII large subunit [Natronospora cellulosivora (SeqCode)]